MTADLMPYDVARVVIGLNVGREVTEFVLSDPDRGRLDVDKLGGTQSYVDVTDRVRRITIRRGASRTSSPLIRYEAGHCEVVLDTRDRAFDPTNLDGPYVVAGRTQITPMRPVQISARLVSDQPTRNLVHNPSFELGTTGWEAQGNGAIAMTRAQHIKGSRALVITRLGSSPPFALYGARTTAVAGPTAAGDTVTVSAYVLIPAESWPHITGFLVGGDGIPNTFVSLRQIVPGQWSRVTYTAQLTAPLAAVQFQFWTDDQHQDGAVVGYLDGVQVEVSPKATQYVDGSIPGCRWEGDAHASASSRPHEADFPLFHGFVDAWDLTWQDPSWAEVTVTATDAFKILERSERAAVDPVGAGELSGARIHRILDTINWPAVDRVIDQGTVTLQATTLEGSALEELHQVADAELGDLFIRGDGRIVFRSRNASYTAPNSAVSTLVIGDQEPELPYKSVELSYDHDTLINRVIASRRDGEPVVLEDLESIDEYWPQAITQSDLLLEDDTAVTIWAGVILSTCSQPELRFTQVELWPRMNPELWPFVLGREIGDRITIVRRPPGGGPPITQDAFIRGIEHEVTPTNWITRWALQSADRYRFLVLDTDNGRLDQFALAF